MSIAYKSSHHLMIVEKPKIRRRYSEVSMDETKDKGGCFQTVTQKVEPQTHFPDVLM